MSKETTHSLSAEIAVAIAGVSPDDYRGLLAAIDAVLKKYGVSKRQTVKDTNQERVPTAGHCG